MGYKLLWDWVLQDLVDYFEVLEIIILFLFEQMDVELKDIIGIGIDFMVCMILLVDSIGQLLCMLLEYEEELYSYVKFWKYYVV